MERVAIVAHLKEGPELPAKGPPFPEAIALDATLLTRRQS